MNFKKTIPYLIAILIFVIASLIYFNPVLSGKQIKQSDITQFTGMAQEIVEYRAEKGEEPYWLGNAFSGMPAYQVSAYYPNDYISVLDNALRFLPRPADYLFLYFLCFFVLLIALKVNWKLAVLGSLSFGFSTYLIIIFGAGHNAKAHAIAYIPLVVAGFIYVFQKRYLLGFIITAVAMALEIYTNHPQMTYYLAFSLLILGIVELINAIKQKQIPVFIKQVSVILIAVILGAATNAPRLMAMKEYADFSTRGTSELTITPDGKTKPISKGLDKDYITEYSYGIWETFNLMIPRFMGGGTAEELSESSNFYQVLEENAGRETAREYSKQALTYWGTQPIVEAPAYIGAVVVFLFFLGVFLIENRLKYWLIASVVFSILMSWGKNFSGLTNFFIDYIPLYSKFRAVSSIQVIAEFCMPLLGVLALKDFFSKDVDEVKKEEALKKAVYVVGGIALFFMLFGSSLFAFEGIRDGSYQQLPALIDAIISDRKSMLFTDSLRTLILVLLSGGLLWFLLKKKIQQVPVIIALSVLILFDLISVDINYVNKEDFTSKRKVKKPFTLTQADKEILKDKSHYRVIDLTKNPMMDGRTSYFHKSVGGYHAAKMRKYQELFDYQIAKNNLEILNMLNVKYFIAGNDKVEQNPAANGNAWFVEKLKVVNSANKEIQALDSLQTKSEAVIRIPINTVNFKRDSLANIKLLSYSLTDLKYESNNTNDGFAVFSEIFYKDGWNAYIDGIKAPYYNVNYVLRGMEIPAGKHIVEFKFEPTVIKNGKLLSTIAYLLIIILPLGWYFVERKKAIKK